MLIDTHAHLDFPPFDQDRDDVVARAAREGIEYIVNVGSSLIGARRSVELAQQYPSVYAAVGIHPHEADTFKSEDIAALKDLLSHPKVVAVGEIGLDFFKNFSRMDAQRRQFAELLAFAKGSLLPIILHCREAQDDTLAMLKEFAFNKVVVHCFSGPESFLKACLDAGFMVSYTANITYKKAEVLRALVAQTPLDRLMLETDAPYLSPEGFRGKRNEPAQVKRVAEAVAQIKGVTVEEVSLTTTRTARGFFGIPQDRL